MNCKRCGKEITDSIYDEFFGVHPEYCGDCIDALRAEGAKNSIILDTERDLANINDPDGCVFPQ